MKIRFCKQRDHYSCGPVAILNILRWIYYPVRGPAYRDYFLYLYDLCDTSTDGTYDEDLDKALREVGDIEGFKVRRPRKRCIKKLKHHLEIADSAAIVGHKEPNTPHEWHYSMILKDPDSNNWFAINFSDGRKFYTFKKISPDYLTKHIDCSAVWLVRKFRIELL